MSKAPANRSEVLPADLVGAEFPFTLEDFTRLARILRLETGIILEQAKMPMLYARLVKRVRGLGLTSFDEYCAHIAAPEGAGERQRMLEALTTNVTRFFREPHHFEHLKKRVLPELISQARLGKRVRLWSAGCSSGEEPYSIALTILSVMPDAAQCDVKILATDIDNDVLQRGRMGIYRGAAIAPIAPDLLSRWFHRSEIEGAWEVGPELRSLVAFRNANLVGAWPMKGPFQAIFCRNTVIYFDDDARAQIWNKMVTLLSPGGHLYIGHSERMPAGAHRLRPAALTVYRRETRKSDELDATGVEAPLQPENP
jgi:chemotaxis protein methyltransferase CheR